MVRDAPGPGDMGEEALQGRPASAPPPDQQTDKPGGHGPLLDDGELLPQLFAHFGTVPFVGGEKRKWVALPERRRSLS